YRGKLTLSHEGKSADVGGSLLAEHDGGWRDASGLEEQKLNFAVARKREDASMVLRLTATNLNQETAGFSEGQDAFRNEAIARANPNPEAYRDAYAMRVTGRYEQRLTERLTLAVRPYLRHSRMDFLQHFLIGKPLEENGQDSIGVLSAL